MWCHRSSLLCLPKCNVTLLHRCTRIAALKSLKTCVGSINILVHKWKLCVYNTSKRPFYGVVVKLTMLATDKKRLTCRRIDTRLPDPRNFEDSTHRHITDATRSRPPEPNTSSWRSNLRHILHFKMPLWSTFCRRNMLEKYRPRSPLSVTLLSCLPQALSTEGTVIAPCSPYTCSKLWG